eukprot:CAMPEP_0195060084 /NCGR_PEP_ID=MMETSP0448-20130528/7432_1 /TAXON_ID=66468 /ORGANISM="Heterocapsa triquestra, Strain CCMP 448" /LENGTH=515 /DNA_ID=CAMNT_0040090447 /DNA_START=447 /DNA_END=1994 /DNA_ORIENTATION=+
MAAVAPDHGLRVQEFLPEAGEVGHMSPHRASPDVQLGALDTAGLSGAASEPAAKPASDSAASHDAVTVTEEPNPNSHGSDSEASTADTVNEGFGDEAGRQPGQQHRRTRAARDKAAGLTQGSRRHSVALRTAQRALGQLAENDVGRGPVLLLNLEKVSKTLRRWQQQLPRVEPHFVVRSGVNRDLLELLHQSGCSFSCATVEELRCALAHGVPSRSILLSSPSTPRAHLRYARTHGVDQVPFDSEAQLQKIAADLPNGQLLMHVACPKEPGIRQGLSLGFGADRPEWRSLLAHAQGLNLQVSGLAVHQGGTSFGRPSVSPDSAGGGGGFSEALVCAREVVELATEFGFSIETLNIGCILPPLGPYRVCDPLLAHIAGQLEQHFPAAEFPALRIMAEPGRLLLARGGASLLTRAGDTQASSAWSLDHDGNAQRGLAVGALVACMVASGAIEEPQPPQRCSLEGGSADDQHNSKAWLLWQDLDAYAAAAGLGSGEPVQALHYGTAARRAAPLEVSRA